MAYTTINKPSEYFNTKLWNGNSSTQAITGVGFQPDFVWLKQRTGTQRHQLLDAIRGTNNILISDGTDAATQDTDILNSFDSDGYTLGYQDQSNDTGFTYVGWNWKANGSGVSNTDGSITSTVSANTTSGFSIVKWTSGGSTQVGHGLGVSPNLIIIKSTSSADNWVVGSSALGWTNRLRLNTTDASSSSGAFQNTDPTSLIFYENYSASSCDKIAYCFAEKKGFSKFGSYTGNGNADGTFVYTGFKPKFTIIKRTDSLDDWTIWDSARNSYNGVNWTLEANGTGAEWSDANFAHDYLSNGFKLRNSFVQTNVSGGTFIYMAFAENPLVGTNNIPATAR